MPEHRGLTYEVRRQERYSVDGDTLRLIVDGNVVITATQLQRRGYDGPEDGGRNWTVQLREYAEAYIDGLEAGVNGDHSLESR